MAEQGSLKPEVAGSIPVGGTIVYTNEGDMLGTFVRDLAKAAAEVVVSPITVANEVGKAFEREVTRATSDKSEKNSR